MEHKSVFISSLQFFSLVLLSSTSHGKVTFWPYQYVQTTALETTLKISANECARRCPSNPNCQHAFCETVNNSKCYALSEIDSFTPGTFEPGNYTISVSSRYAFFSPYRVSVLIAVVIIYRTIWVTKCPTQLSRIV